MKAMNLYDIRSYDYLKMRKALGHCSICTQSKLKTLTHFITRVNASTIEQSLEHTTTAHVHSLECYHRQ